jgi:hypothetical protein
MCRKKLTILKVAFRTFRWLICSKRGAKSAALFLKLLRISLESGVEMENMIELSQEDLDLIAGGQASATHSISHSASGPSTATLSSTVSQTVSVSVKTGASAMQTATDTATAS